MAQWVHGWIMYLDKVVEVHEKRVRRGGGVVPLRTESLGWEARINLDTVVIQTTKLYPTQKEAEQAISGILHDWIKAGIDNGYFPVAGNLKPG